MNKSQIDELIRLEAKASQLRAAATNYKTATVDDRWHSDEAEMAFRDALRVHAPELLRAARENAELQAEVDRRIDDGQRRLLMRALCRATGATEEEIACRPFGAAIEAAERLKAAERAVQVVAEMERGRLRVGRYEHETHAAWIATEAASGCDLTCQNTLTEAVLVGARMLDEQETARPAGQVRQPRNRPEQQETTR